MAKDYYQLILKNFHLDDANIINVYPFGSRVYETYSPKSDYDFMVVVKDGSYKDDRRKADNININIIEDTHFRMQLKRHRMSALECLFLPPELLLKNTVSYSEFRLNLPALKKYVVEKTAEDWWKAQKACMEGDIFYIKSVFHTIRTLIFALQIIDNGKIENYCVKSLLNELCEYPPSSWDECEETYGKTYTKLLKEINDKVK